MLRLFALLFFLPVSAMACSCVDNYVPLPDKICAAEYGGQVVLEVVVAAHVGTDVSRVRVVSRVVGSNVPNELRLKNGSSSICGMSIAGVSRGQRYLLLADSASVASGEIRLFACGSDRTVYRMNSRGTQVEYPSTTGLRFQAFDRQLVRGACTAGPGRPPRSPLLDIRAYQNPGEGRLQLGVPAGDFPELSSLEVYTSAGSLITHFEMRDYLPGSVLDLTSLPSGSYLLLISDESFRRTLPYVITR